MVPDSWELLPPGDAGVTRRVKAAGPTWAVAEKRGRKEFSQGIWAPADNIRRAQSSMEAERSTPAYARKMEQAKSRRDREQAAYVREFADAVRGFLEFHADHHEWEERLALAVTEHAVPVGSGTVARTVRIPVEDRARAAVIAWMRHQTTAYDDMHIPREKGRRREVRKMLAERSRALLRRYRRPGTPEGDCPLLAALSGTPVPKKPAPTDWTPIKRPTAKRGGWASGGDK